MFEKLNMIVHNIAFTLFLSLHLLNNPKYRKKCK